MIVAVVARRGRVAVAEPYFEPGEPLTLGRRAMAEVGEGELVAVEPTNRGNGRLLAHIGSPDDIHAVMEAVALDAGVARPGTAAGVRSSSPTGSSRPAGSARPFDLHGRSAHREGLRRCLDGRLSDGLRLASWCTSPTWRPTSPPGSELDLDAEDRATSVYLPGRVDPMLPSELSDGACSLSPGDDRRAVTVTLDPAGGAPVFRRTLIRSDHRLTYEQADAVLAGGEAESPELTAAVRAAAAAAERLPRRSAAGRRTRPGDRRDGAPVRRGTGRRRAHRSSCDRGSPDDRGADGACQRSGRRVARSAWRAHALSGARAAGARGGRVAGGAAGGARRGHAAAAGAARRPSGVAVRGRSWRRRSTATPAAARPVAKDSPRWC